MAFGVFLYLLFVILSLLLLLSLFISRYNCFVIHVCVGLQKFEIQCENRNKFTFIVLIAEIASDFKII